MISKMKSTRRLTRVAEAKKKERMKQAKVKNDLALCFQFPSRVHDDANDPY